MNNKKYLDKVVGSLVRGTILDYDREEIHFPFSRHSSSPPLGPRLPFLHNTLPSRPFEKYCRDTFGLTDKEIDFIWNEYKDIIIKKIHKNDIKTVVMELMGSTKIDCEKKTIHYPFQSSPSNLLLSPLSFNFYRFSDYCKDIYNSTEEEIEYIWKEYSNIITDKSKECRSIISDKIKNGK